ncbi:hypothetical protein K2173_005332 [Erythroxylum novogranatense]|uniref:Acid phosphatase n=1 Tax=Erythroxylum novogranatense TaxID=1862640 RepID=A0AAV8TIJ4_9ROSI|nr:hypothetical protein K2173_005332 [Erythroxylum novogranatense]
MAASKALFSLSFLLCSLPAIISQSFIRIPSDRSVVDNDIYCESWRLSVETNNSGKWSLVPSSCASYVEKYMNGDKFLSDSEVAFDNMLAYAATVEVGSDGKDAWIFDVDETLISNLPYYKLYGEATLLPVSLRFYKKLQQLGFTIILLTGRTESQRTVTVQNLLKTGYSHWSRLILRNTTEKNDTALVFKSRRRAELAKEGYKLHGCSGDQWSDLVGYPMAKRIFKVPNPLYYLS